MRKIIITFIVIMIAIISSQVYAEKNENVHIWKQLNQTSDQVLQFVKNERYEEAKQLLHYFSELFLQLNLQDEHLSMESLRVMTNEFETAVGAVNAVNLPHVERVHAVTSFRLVVDALTSEHQPLWLQTEKTMNKLIMKLQKSVKEEQSLQFQRTLNEFLMTYEMIRPAVQLHISREQSEKIRSQIIFLEKERTKFNVNVLQPHLQIIEEEWANIYAKVKKDSADPSLWWVMIAMGGMITTALVYTGWKKYKAEKRKVREHE